MKEQKQVQKQLFKLNRFPVCMTFYYSIAKRQGYNEKQAMALGYAVALFFAIMKNKGGYLKTTINSDKSKKSKKSTSKTKYEKELEKELKENPITEISIDRLTFEGIIDKKENYIKPIVANRIISYNDFMNELKKKLNDKEIDVFLKYSNDFIISKQRIKNAFNLYKSIRDEWRKRQFFDFLIDLYSIK